MRRPNNPGGAWSGRAFALVRRHRRATCGWIADVLGVHPRTVASWQRAPRGGAPYPTAARVEELADVLDVPVEALRSLVAARRVVRESQRALARWRRGA